MQLLTAVYCSEISYTVNHCSPNWIAVVTLYFHCGLTAKVSSVRQTLIFKHETLIYHPCIQIFSKLRYTYIFTIFQMLRKISKILGLTILFLNGHIWSKFLHLSDISEWALNLGKAKLKYTRGKKEIHPYYISPIEMRSLWMEIKCVKSATRLLVRTWINKRGLDLSKEVL